ncbi:MAG TPA: enoyl-CoA hydratase-related protein [Actinomycetes bacterium]|jgi:enoyl-CoA hydratase/carnithine racemase|nr:enoyl-CoA hydratase-related protein [Actinomycetes bacterium]
MGEAVTYELQDGVVWLVIDRPEARNAVNRAVAEGLWEGFRRFEADEGAAVLVLTGAGDAFCAGADLKEMAALGLTVPPRDMTPNLGRNIQVTKPVIAAVNGPAFGGGFLLAQMCDLCVAGTSARFAVTEARWGRGAPWAAPLPWLVPPRVAMELLLTGEPIDARRAYEVGLVNRVVPDPELRSEAGRLARRIADNAPLSVRAAKAMVHAAAGRELDEAVEEGWRLFEPVYLSEDAQEGPRAFVERRPPVWKGR